MNRTFLLTAIFTIMLLSSGFTTVPDTARIGDQTAYYMGDGVIRIPVFFFNDNGPVNGLGLSFLFITTGDPIFPDSLTRAGRTAGTNIFDMFFDLGTAGSPWGGNPDSVCTGMISMHEPLPSGEGTIADLWFSGAAPGDLISFQMVPVVMTCNTDMSPPDPDGGLIFPVTLLTVSEADLLISCGTSHEIAATTLLQFPVTVYGNNLPISLEIENFYGPSSQFPTPSLSGNSPWTFSWQPAFQNTGTYTAVLHAEDALGNESHVTVSINVTEIESDPCAVVRGDLNCDGFVDITDLLFLVEYMFGGGPPSGCN